MRSIGRISFFTVLKGLVLILVICATLLPFLHMTSVSLSNSQYVIRNEVGIYPKGFNIEMYKIVLRDPRILTAYKNTVFYAAVGTALSLLITCMASYALSKSKKLMFHKGFTFMIIFAMYFNGGMIPTYLTVKAFNPH